MFLAGLPSETGLGYLDTTKSVLELEMELKGEADSSGDGDLAPQTHGKRSRMTAKRSARLDQTKVIPVTIHQDLGMLKGKKGDTGK